MSYELFEKAAAINGEFEIIPSKTSLLSKGITIDKHGYIQFRGKTYLPNMVKLEDLPPELRKLFIENTLTAKEDGYEVAKVERPTQKTIEVKEKKNDNFDSLNKILFEQLQNIVNPEDGTDINHEIKKANTVCNVADKLISIADLSLKAEIFYEKQRVNSSQSLYQG